MTRVNPYRLPEEERINRKVLREAIIAPSGEEDPDIYTKQAFAYRFKVKKPAIDAQGAVDAYYFEEGMRQKYFYPFIKKGTIFFDIGSAHGSWTLPALALGARVYAFEPDPRWAEGMVSSAKINRGFLKRLTLINQAVSDEPYQHAIMDELEDVSCITLDNFVKASGVTPDYIKIDTEGMEGRVIVGASKTLTAENKPRLMIEHHPMVAPNSMDWIVQKLQEMGYWYTPLRQRTDWVAWSFWEPTDIPSDILEQAYNK